MKLYNTLSRKVEEFKPQPNAKFPSENLAKIYSCGPTVYNVAHIGNLSSYVFADTLRRVAKLAGYQTKQIMNLTDVDDKVMRDSKQEFPDLPPMEALTKLTTNYSEIFLREMAEVGCDTNAISFFRATDNIREMQDLIRKLLREKIAYVADDGVYFSISEYQKTRKYGQLSHIELAKDRRSRIDNDEYDKDSAADFALWKAQKPGEPAWDFELDSKNLRGHPGWHIECSAMSAKNLGQPFDIHTGGVDLIFPHHENEIAQSTAGDQPEKLANFFVHNEHLLVDGKKMAKSAHNFYTLNDIHERGYDPLDFRMLVLQSHYRSATNFSWENLEAAKNRRQNWRNVAELRWQLQDENNPGLIEIVGLFINTAIGKLLDDLNTPEALSTIDAAFSAFNFIGKGGHNAKTLEALINFVDISLGLDLRKTTPDILNEEKALIREREAARAAKDFAKSDEIRDELLSRGIELKDSENGTIWSRK